MTRKEIKRLDKLWSTIVRRTGRCRRCGKVGLTYAHHIFSRNHYSTRWYIENGIELCRRCHLYFAHTDGVSFTYWLMGWMGKRKIKALERKANKIISQDYDRVKKKLETFKWKIENIPL